MNMASLRFYYTFNVDMKDFPEIEKMINHSKPYKILLLNLINKIYPNRIDIQPLYKIIYYK